MSDYLDGVQERLFRLAVEDMHLNLHYVMGEGWQLSIWIRRGDESPEQASQERYARLTTEELGDLVETCVRATLGL